ncbi:MAG TPA: NAD(P)H-hydrate dehydratase, partial [Kaistella sp.]|nr:NAD(P)H-hydrate dehydratase [Kaistella sp.]
ISIDIPSGLFADKMMKEETVVFKADETLSFQFWKKSFLHPETGVFCGNINILDIGLGKEFIQKEPSENFVIDETLIRNIYKPHNEFSNKGTYGKTTVVAGSFGKMGAAVLATKAALKSGSGLTFTLAPKCGYEILQTTCPEAMYLYGGEDFISHFDVEENSVVGIGPGLGTDPETENTFLEFLKNYSKPLVLDADALNIISKNTGNLRFIPKNSIITPHPKEFERLFGKTENSFDRLELSKKKSEELEIFIVLKDHHTQIITPENKVYYNITGNSGMAKGGSGDVLLGLITSLLAQNYSPKNASIFGVWLHGKAGDFAAEKHSKEAMLPSDLIDELGNAFKTLKK